MSEENVEIVRRAIAMFLSGDVEGAIREYADPAMEFVSRFGLMDGRAYSGESELPNYMDDIAETWERYERELEELIEAGDAVVAVLKITAVSKTTGLEVNERVGVAFWLENRRILRMVSFPTVPEALEAAESSDAPERPEEPKPPLPRRSRSARPSRPAPPRRTAPTSSCAIRSPGAISKDPLSIGVQEQHPHLAPVAGVDPAPVR